MMMLHSQPAISDQRNEEVRKCANAKMRELGGLSLYCSVGVVSHSAFRYSRNLELAHSRTLELPNPACPQLHITELLLQFRGGGQADALCPKRNQG